ncbi:MAG TPA: TlpA disulfide reductase family protein [Candidatus Tumulicola sp.]|nr:TlpA disulfide reductase family protein [Candidatus Tumulicola sp.]
MSTRAERRRQQRDPSSGPRRTGKIVAVVIALVAIAAIAAYAIIQHNQVVSGAAVSLDAFPPAAPSPAPAGVKAPAFSVSGPLGSITNASLAGKPYLLELFATWCPHCQRMTKVLKSIRSKIQESKLAIISVTASGLASDATPNNPVPESQADVEAFDKKFGVSWPTFFDPKFTVANAFGIAGFPQFYVVDANGKIVWSQGGEMKESRLLAGLHKAGL